MTNKERYQRAFSSLHTSENFKVRLEDNAMAAKYFKTRRALVAACAVLALIIGGTSAYAADIGGIQRVIQIWIHGDLTDAILRVDEGEGTYSLTDGNGNVVEEGGGVAIEADGTERPLTSEEIAEDMENQVSTETIEGRMYLFYRKQKYDITDEFSGSDYCYLTLKDGGRTIYVTVTKNGGIATSEKRYLMPNEFCVE